MKKRIILGFVFFLPVILVLVCLWNIVGRDLVDDAYFQRQFVKCWLVSRQKIEERHL